MTSRLWQEPDIKELENMDGVMSTVCHSGAYGATNNKGEMIRKGFRFMSNCPELLNRLQRKLDPEQLQQCVPLQGKETTRSQRYPHKMVMEILAGMKEAALDAPQGGVVPFDQAQLGMSLRWDVVQRAMDGDTSHQAAHAEVRVWDPMGQMLAHMGP